MSQTFHFERTHIDSLIGGNSILDTIGLRIKSLEDAKSFVKSYGYDVDKEEDLNRLWGFHRRAVTFIQENLLIEGEQVPDSVSDPNQLKDILYLVIYASTKDSRENSLHKWSCAVLKVMHVLVHLENDLFSQFSLEIQDQILSPIKSHIVKDPILGTYLGNSETGKIPINKYVVKTFKSVDSSIIKLLAKKDAVAFSLLDKLGVRFVTKTIFDCFRVMKYLVSQNIVSYPHNISDQSNNTLYPVNVFLETMESFVSGTQLTPDEVDKVLLEKLDMGKEKAIYNVKRNPFTSSDYRFIKFITRKLINIDIDSKRGLSFFYPFEVQIMDYQTYLSQLEGPAAHAKYKERQKTEARKRVFGENSVAH